MKKRSVGGYFRKFFKRLLPALIPALIVLVALIGIFAVNGIAPFGDRTVAVDDAILQYADFFAWYKDVLQGEDSIGWTYTKQLGGNAFAVFSYYLSSPFSLLVLFFEKSDFHSLFTTMVISKLVLAAITSYIFFAHKLKVRKVLSKEYWLASLLAISYAISTYSIQQMSNIMWLDGVYMLPLILLGVSKIVNSKKPKGILLLALSSGLSIIFNWYTGLINLLFAGIWFIIECVLRYIDKKNLKKIFVKKILPKAGRALISVVLGILIGVSIILPTLGALSEGGRAELDFNALLDGSLLGAPIASIQNYAPGLYSSLGVLVIYCGTIPLLIFMTMLISKKVKASHKIAYCTILVVLLLTYYFSPLYMLFSLLKTDATYWVRYSYGILFILLALTLHITKTEPLDSKKIPLTSLIFAGIAILTQESSTLSTIYIEARLNTTTHIYALLVILLAILIKIAIAKQTLTSVIILSILLLSELFYSAGTIVDEKSTYDLKDYIKYQSSTAKQIQDIKQLDAGFYRINHTDHFAPASLESQFAIDENLNESMGYNFYSIGGYTSSPDDKQRTFLDKLGYRKMHSNQTTVKDSILSADTLLGAKYITSKNILTELNFTGYQSDLNSFTYENPYALPLGFVIDSYTGIEQISEDKALNTFEYQNLLYQKISNLDIDIFEKIPHTESIAESLINYSLSYPNEDSGTITYANLNYGDIVNLSITNKIFKNQSTYYSTITDDEGNLITEYAGWGTPSVFIIPSGTKNITSTMGAYRTISKKTFPEADFYSLNLNKLKTVTDQIKQNGSPLDYVVNDKETSFKVSGSAGKYLFTSIPAQKGTTVYNNGKQVDFELFEDTLIVVPLQDGINNITIEHRIPHLGLYIFISFLATIGAIAYPIYLQKHQ